MVEEIQLGSDTGIRMRILPVRTRQSSADLAEGDE